ncbi:MAG: glycosyltransferase family 4 protein [Bacillota bacterium]
MDKIRVLHVVRPSEGGIKNHLLSLIEGADRCRYEHMVACPYGRMAEAFEEMGAITFPLPLKGEMSPSSDMAAVKALISILKEHRVDIIHVHGSKAGVVGRLAAMIAGVPFVVMTVHNSIFYDHLPAWKTKIYAAAERFLAGRTKKIITVSEALRRELIFREKIGPEKLITVYNGIETDIFMGKKDRVYAESVLGIPSGKKIVGTVARLAPQKGVKFFIQAAALLAEKIDGLVFVVIGDGPLRHELEDEARKLKVADIIIFTGERKDVPGLMPGMDVFVLASVTEGLPLTILEAMVAGRPVVATRVGGIPEIIDEEVNGILVDPGDAMGLAAAVEAVLADKEKAERMGEYARSRVLGNFTACMMVNGIESVYAGIV